MFVRVGRMLWTSFMAGKVYTVGEIMLMLVILFRKSADTDWMTED